MVKITLLALFAAAAMAQLAPGPPGPPGPYYGPPAPPRPVGPPPRAGPPPRPYGFAPGPGPAGPAVVVSSNNLGRYCRDLNTNTRNLPGYVFTRAISMMKMKVFANDV